MNIHGRIIARKVLLIRYYQKYFLLSSLSKGAVQTDVSKISKIVAPYQEEQTDQSIVDSIQDKNLLGENMEEVLYILKQYFTDQDPAEIDYSYITTMAGPFEANIPVVENLVNTFATSFKFKDMDIIDQMIFVLGYTEFTTIGTTKEVLLNEMIEIAKRYGDESSSKLINGIGHKILS